jgi:hypothetical protein
MGLPLARRRFEIKNANLGLTYHPVSTAAVEMFQQLIDTGAIKAKSGVACARLMQMQVGRLQHLSSPAR